MVRYWRGYLSGAKCRLSYGPADATAAHCCSLVLLFWYRLTRVVQDKGPLNGCVCVHYNMSCLQYFMTSVNYFVAYDILLQPFNGLFSRTTWVSRYQKSKTNEQQ